MLLVPTEMCDDYLFIVLTWRFIVFVTSAKNISRRLALDAECRVRYMYRLSPLEYMILGQSPLTANSRFHTDTICTNTLHH